MNVPIVHHELHELNSEQLPDRPISLLNRVWQGISRAMSPSYEPVVKQKVDRQGRIIHWQVYDPLSGQSISFSSELEVRLWLEDRYYR